MTLPIDPRPWTPPRPGEGPALPTIAALVAALWAEHPVEMPASLPEPPAPAHVVEWLADALADVADRAAASAARMPDETRGARLLAETGRTLVAVLRKAGLGDRRADVPEQRRVADVLRRLGRMERWLLASAEHDPALAPSGDLCLWVLEHLESATAPLVAGHGRLPDV